MVECIPQPAETLSAVCTALSTGTIADAQQLLRIHYPFKPIRPSGRDYTPRQCMVIFRRDGFLDRYSGRRLVFPGTLRLLSKLLPEDFPFHPNWKSDRCHFAYWELFPTIDHVVPVSRGGTDDATNWVTASMLANTAKANFVLSELGWTLRPERADPSWDGLTSWCLDVVDRDPTLRADRYIRQWCSAARAAIR